MLRRTALELFAASFIVLFQELSLIRWLAGQIRVLAYFPNLILLSAFLGLGLGCLSRKDRPLRWLWPLALGGLCVSAMFMSRVVITQLSSSEHLWLLYYDLPHTAPVFHDLRLPLLFFFSASALCFVPLGQIVASRLQVFRSHGKSLEGYCWDIVGSLVGVAAFSALSFARTFPVLWFALFLSAGFVFFSDTQRARLLYPVLALIVLAVIGKAERAQAYSPYYAIGVQSNQEGGRLRVLANGSLHQVALNLNRQAPDADDWSNNVRRGYHVPYDLLKRTPKNVLVLGAGTGNDVAVLLDRGAERIDAVEIDPVILSLGKTRHPTRPYDSPRVRVFNTDARSFLTKTHQTYDLIVFGTLDSMTHLSAMSRVRLDNFVYTLESLRAARSRLTTEGGMLLYFMVANEDIYNKLIGLLTLAFDQLPAIYRKHHGLFNTIFMSGPAFDHLRGPNSAAAEVNFRTNRLPRLDVPTDDWPFLYLNAKKISRFYLTVMGLIAAVSLVSVFLVSPEMRRSYGGSAPANAAMFLLGAAFLMLETRAVTIMNLVWGATWATNAVVFGAILIMVLASALAANIRTFPPPLSASGVIVSLLIVYAFPIDSLLGFSPPSKLILSVMVVGTPVFFAGMLFSGLFKDHPQADIAFGWNLLGAVAGGLAEFLSMVVGFKALLLLTVGVYLGVLLIHQRTAR